jgi:protein O-mannosyl-transferase
VSRRTGALLVTVVALLLYLPSVQNGFAYDDNSIIRMDARIHDASALLRVFVQPYWASSEIGLYRPLASLSYAVDWAISGGSPLWFHAVNVAWNAAVCGLVFLLLAAFVQPLPALLGALLFAAHPVHTEAVANVVGRAEIMAAFFSLCAMLLWLREPAAPRSARRIAALAALYLLALLSKESAVMLPALLALTDVARGTLKPVSLRDWMRSHTREIVVLGVTAAAFIALRTAVIGTVAPGLLDPVLDVGAGSWHRTLTALQAWPVVAVLLVYPRVLLADYGPGIITPALTPSPATLLGAGILLGLVAVGVAAWLRGHGRIAFVALFVPVALLPVSNLIVPIGVIVAERALYLPSLAVAAAVALGAQAVWDRPRHRLAVGAAVLAVSALFALRTLVRIPEWTSTPAIMAALERDRPDSYRAHWYFAQRAVNLQQRDEALARYARALSIWPYRERLTLEAAAYAAQAGDAALAEQITTFAIQNWPRHIGFLRLHAALQLERGSTDDAAATLVRALRLAPHDSLLLGMQRALNGMQAP